MKDVVMKRGLHEDALLKDTSDGACKVYGFVPRLESLLLTNTDSCARQANRQVILCASQAISRYVAATTSWIALRSGKLAVRREQHLPSLIQSRSGGMKRSL